MGIGGEAAVRVIHEGIDCTVRGGAVRMDQFDPWCALVHRSCDEVTNTTPVRGGPPCALASALQGKLWGGVIWRCQSVL